MRDDFSKSTKDILSKRVGLKCSNPDCRCLTAGPNSDPEKSTNVGVAAHICAASINGPRFDSSMSQSERQSPTNGIWLCQTCSKLVDSDIHRFTVELLMRWKTEAEIDALNQLNKKPSSQRNYQAIIDKMPDLIFEMRQDLKGNPLAREFVLLKKGWCYNSPEEKVVLCYYYDEHEALENKIQILMNNNLVKEITFNQVKRYLFTEEFVTVLCQG